MPPLKRRRMAPDGFLTTAPYKRVVVPQFSSAFNQESADKRNPQLKTDAPRPPPKPPYRTTSTLLKPAVPPPLLVNKHPSKDLKSLQPPPVPLPSNPTIDSKNLRTISKTRVALATDLSTDSGVAELASIFLHDQHPDITLPNSHPDNHDRRGLGLSPEKKGKGKQSKFIRGGLAAHASAFFEQSQTSLVLWQKERERRANTVSSSDLRVNIIKILQKPLPSHTSSKTLISPGIALCRIRQETNNTSSYSNHESYNLDDLYRIVFSFSSCVTQSLFNDPHQFSEGRTVRICCPWQEISFREESSTSVLPASLPLPSSEPTLTPDVAVNDKALLPVLCWNHSSLYLEYYARMTSMHSDAFDVIPYEDIKGNWKKLGSGSFGNVYKGTYLGIDVAIKEVLPSTEYDVAKYFEREWRLMKECRHPNICLFIGLSRAPHPDNRIFIISEFIENGNVRLYIHDKTKPFPWRVRLSFATDVTRALAYLHARKCIHRDLKGENLLVTENGRLKVTDFGFARIAARNEEESKRLTFCGTDSYMSPEILLGDEFDLPTDIFSLGIIFCEIGARKLADNSHFKRLPPSFGIETEEARKLMSLGCPPDFFQLCLDCLSTKPETRPTTRDILDRLRAIEAEVLLRPSEDDDVNVGSVRFMTGGKRPAHGLRIPSFGMGVGKEIKQNGISTESESDDDELMEAVTSLSSVGLSSDWSNSTSLSREPLINRNPDLPSSEYSTTVNKSHGSHHTIAPPPSLSSILTVKPSPILTATPPSSPPSPGPSTISSVLPNAQNNKADILTDSLMSIASLDSYRTAASLSIISSTCATEGGGSTVRSLHGNYVSPLVHRFTLLKPGKQRRNSGSVSPAGHGKAGSPESAAGWNPLEMFFSSGLLIGKCDLCNKRLGWKPVLECDDCGLRTHTKCGEVAPRDCGQRTRHHTHGEHKSPLHAISPLSKVKLNATNASEEMMSKSTNPAAGR